MSKSQPNFRLTKRRFEFSNPVTPGDGSGASSDKADRTDGELQPSDGVTIWLS